MSGWWALLAAWSVLLAWLILVLGRGAFWRADQRLPLRANGAPRTWPEVTAVVPARNEAEGIGDCVTALLRQDYPGVLRVIVVDDQSEDGTAECAREAARRVDATSRLEVLSGAPLPENWAGKVWAMAQGVTAAGLVPLLWFTDGDIVHGPDVLQRLVTQIEDQDRSLVSLMVMLSCRSFWERLLIPPFIFFFQMLYPFPWVNNPRRVLAGAAGGCMLLRRETLEKAGGFVAMRAARIDDCTLAALVKPHGAIWLGLGTESYSLRDYQRLGEIWRMVARSAYVQLQFSPWRLLGEVSEGISPQKPNTSLRAAFLKGTMPVWWFFARNQNQYQKPHGIRMQKKDAIQDRRANFFMSQRIIHAWYSSRCFRISKKMP